LSRVNGKKDVIEKIQRWIKEEGFQSSIAHEPYTDFQVNLKNPNMSIILFNNKVDSVYFATYAGFDEADKKAFASLKDKEKKLVLLCDLQRSLIAINVEYSILPNLDNLDRINISKKVYFDGLTKDKFIDTIFALNRAHAAVQLMYQQLRGVYQNSGSNLTI
jgi:hypothetical protein